jgi:FtsX-like permease family protein
MFTIVLAMVWSRRGQAVTLALLSLFGVAAAVAAPAYLRAADRAVAAGQVATADPADRTVALTTRLQDHRHDEAGSGVADISLAGSGAALVGLPGFTYTYGAEFAAIGIDPDRRERTRLVYRQRVCDHLVMTAGRCLIGESDVILGESTARRFRMSPGDAVTLTAAVFAADPDQSIWVPSGEPKHFLVAGVYRVTDPADVYWGAHLSGEPAFVNAASVTAMDHGTTDVSIDGVAGPGALAVDRLPALRTGLSELDATVRALGPALTLTSGLPDLLARIDAGRAAAHRIVPVLAVSLVLLACLTIYLAVGYGTEGRRPELAVVALRGARWGQRWWLATGENLVAIVAGAIGGCMAGQLVVNAFMALRFPGVGADPGLSALRWAPVAAAAAVLTALLAERRQLTTPVTDLLRRAPVVPNSATAIAADAVVVLLAAAATVQLFLTGGVLTGVGTFAAALVLVAGALIAARLLLPWATVLARRALHRGRIGAALATFQLSRRPGATRLFALLTAAVAVAGYAAVAVDVGARGRAAEVGVRVGAARVVSVGPIGRQGLIQAVRATDPDGRFAMAAVRLPDDPGHPPVLAVDTTRLAAVATWPGPDRVAALLRPPAPAPVLIDGADVSFDLTARGFGLGKQVTVTAVLSPAAGLGDELMRFGVIRDGRDSYALRIPACRGGCTLKSLRIAGGEGSVDVVGRITVHAIRGVGAGVLADPARWRASEGGRVTPGPDGLRIDVTSLNGLASGMFVQPADAPSPLPVATAGVAAVRSVAGFDVRDLPVHPVLRLDALPGAGAPAVLADLDYADRLATDGASTSKAQVWLGDRAPADVLQRLAAHGLVVTGDLRAAQVRRQLDQQGPAVALWFYLIVAGLATALAAGALVLAAAVDRGRRVEDLSAMRGQGLSRAAVRRATLGTYPVLVAVAVLAGTGVAVLGWQLTGWALPLAGIDPPATPLPGQPSPLLLAATAAGLFAVLAGVAHLAGRRTLREIT